MSVLFDTHAHYDSERFDEDRDTLLETLHRDFSIGYILNAGTNVETSKFSLALSKKYDFIYAAAGIHPHDAAEMGENDLLKIRALLKEEKVKALGEIGLDYFYDFSPRELQKEVFARQMEIAREQGLPVIIHEREAWLDTLAIVKEIQGRGVFHCFSGSAESAKIILDLGYMISLTGVLTFKNAKKALEVVKYAPLERLMLETDCPYMAPEPFRGQRNHSGYLRKVAEKMAEIKNMDVEDVIFQTTQNAIQFFGISG